MLIPSESTAARDSQPFKKTGGTPLTVVEVNAVSIKPRLSEPATPVLGAEILSNEINAASSV